MKKYNYLERYSNKDLLSLEKGRGLNKSAKVDIRREINRRKSVGKMRQTAGTKRPRRAGFAFDFPF